MTKNMQFGNPANYNATPPTLADGDASALNVDSAGNLKITAGSPSGTSTALPTDTDPYLGIRSLPQVKTRFGFEAAVSNGVDTSAMTLIATGSGMTVNQSAGSLAITSGTTVAAETIIRSNESWSDALTMRYAAILSQRIVNNNFFVELVDVIGDGLSYTIDSATAITVTKTAHGFTAANIGQSMYVGAFNGTGTFLTGNYPISAVTENTITFTVSGFAVGTGTCSLFGYNYHHVLYTGTTATNAAYGTQRNGYATADITATINTTAAPGHVGIVNAEDGIAAFLDQLSASATSVQTAMRAQSVRNVPEANAQLYLQIRVLNGSVAPASTTTFTLGFVSIENYVPQQVSLTSMRPSAYNFSLPVSVQGTAAVSVASGATTIGKAEDSVAGTGDVGVPPLYIRNDSLTSNVSASGDYIVPVTDIYGAAIVKDQQLQKRSYSIAFTVAPATSATDIFQLIGSASTNVEITKITISGTQTTGGNVNVFISKRSTANSGGTSTTATIVPHISTDAAATAVGTIYTANPTTGTPVGDIEILSVPFGAPASPANNIVTREFGINSKPIILVGVAQTVVIRLGGVTVTGGSISVAVEFTEY